MARDDITSVPVVISAIKDDYSIGKEASVKLDVPPKIGDPHLQPEEGLKTTSTGGILVERSLAGGEPKPVGNLLIIDDARTKLSVTLPLEQEGEMPGKKVSKSKNVREKTHKMKKEKQNSEISLSDRKENFLETESYNKERLEVLEKKRADFALQIRDLQAKVIAFKMKTNPTDDDIANLRQFHLCFLEKMSEFEETTQKVKLLTGMAETPTLHNNKQAEPLIPLEEPLPHEPSQTMDNIEENLLKIITCETDIVNSVTASEPLDTYHLDSSYDHQHFDRFAVSEQENPNENEMFVKEDFKEPYETQKNIYPNQQEVDDLKFKTKQEQVSNLDIVENMKFLTSEEITNYIQKLSKGKTYTGERYEESSLNGNHTYCYKEKNQNIKQKLQNLEDLDKTSCQQKGLQYAKVSLNEAPLPKTHISKNVLRQEATQTDEDKLQEICFETDKYLQYKSLECQYQKLYTDFKNKVDEVSSLKCDLDKTRTELSDITVLHHELEAKQHKILGTNNALLADKNKMQSSRSFVLEIEEEDKFTSHVYSSSHSELEGMKALIADLAVQLDEYRTKYMNALQNAEELKKEKEFLEIEYANKSSDTIQKLKIESQDYLKELMSMKELFKLKQQKLNETEQMHTKALETVAQLYQKLETAMKELEIAHLELEKYEKCNVMLENLKHSLEEAERKSTKLKGENEQLKATVTQIQKTKSEQYNLLQEKSQEAQSLSAQLETLQQECAWQISQVKEQKEMTRKCLQMQVADLEKEVAMCRAETTCANKERDKLRSKLQFEISSLSKNFQESQNQILKLQQQISYLIASHPTAIIDFYK